MPSFRNFYGSKFLNAKTLGKRKVKGKILSADPQSIKGTDGTVATRLVIQVSGEEKPIALNSTNANALGEAYGEDYEKWIGKLVLVTVGKAQFQGQDVDGLKVTPA